MSMAPEWYKPQHVTLGLTKEECEKALEEWNYRDAPIDLRVCKAKTKGMRCIICDIYPERNTQGLYWVSWCIRYLNDVKVDVKEIK